MIRLPSPVGLPWSSVEPEPRYFKSPANYRERFFRAIAQLTTQRRLGQSLKIVGSRESTNYKVEAETVLIAGVTTGGSGNEDRLIENVILNFAKVSVDYTPQKADGSADTAIDQCYCFLYCRKAYS